MQYIQFELRLDCFLLMGLAADKGEAGALPLRLPIEDRMKKKGCLLQVLKYRKVITKLYSEILQKY